MANFIVYDLIFLALFTLVAIIFFYRNKHNLQRHGWIFLYRSKIGLKLIDLTAKKFEKILKPMQYVVITSGYILMVSMIWTLVFSAYRYITTPIPEQLVNVPPIAPLIPYFPKLFNLESIFPPLFFSYFLIALAIVAVSHEFAHGIFAKLHKIKIKNTGLAFFGPFFGAFVEPDEKKMFKLPKLQQLAILAAGTFANVIMTVLFLLIFWWFFVVSFAPTGLNFNAYPQTVIDISSIGLIGNNTIKDINKIEGFIKEDINELTVKDGTLYLILGETLKMAVESDAEKIVVFEDAPAVRAKLRSPILKIDDTKITNPDELKNTLEKYNPGDTVDITILSDGIQAKQSITLADKEGKAYLGVGFVEPKREGLGGFLFSMIKRVKDPLTYYESIYNGDFAQFIYDLLWWIVIINILVALFNMLPLSILDGGRFFYLTIWAVTANEKIGKKAFVFATWFILAILILMMVKWSITFFS